MKYWMEAGDKFLIISMIRIYIPPERIKPDAKTFSLETDETHYLVSVMRLKGGEVFAVFDGKRNEFTASMEKSEGEKRAAARIISRRFIAREERTSITLAACLLKGEKMAWVMQKATELGAAAIIPVMSARTIPRFKKDKWAKKKMRFFSIIKEASEQCGRSTLAKLDDVLDIKELADTVSHYDLALFFNEGEKKNRLKDVLDAEKNVSSVLFLAGPEGGFTGDEAALLIKSGFVSVSLGNRILRSETACMYGMSVLSHVFSV